MRKFTILAGVAALSITAGAALAQDAAKGKAKTPAPARTEASIECSKQADAKGLKGKPRKKFRAKCKKDYKKPA